MNLMMLTPAQVRQFEADQRDHGTRTALYNLLWLKATADLRAIGVTHITTRVARQHRSPLKPRPRASARQQRMSA